MLAEQAFKSLRGLFCIYKPAGVAMHEIVWSIKVNLTKDLNALPCRPPRKIIKYNEQVRESVNGDDRLPVITTVPDLADHPLVVGPRYEEDDFDVIFGDAIGMDGSGVQMMAIGTPGWLKRVVLARYVRVYHVKAELGRSTDTFSREGRTVERTTYDHVTPFKMDRIVAAMQAGHQKHMFTSSGLDLQSQEAYDLAAGGLLRPKTAVAGPVIYGFKCIHFEPPHFTMEIQCINETVRHLQSMVHKLGLELRSGANISQVKRIRYGPLLPDHTLLRKHWKAEHILDNMFRCQEYFTDEKIKHLPQISSRQDDIRELPER